MRFILFFLVFLNWNSSFAQNRRKNKEPFNYSYTVTRERYEFEQTVHLQISKGTNDTIIISGKSDSLNLKGTVSLYNSGLKQNIEIVDGFFQLKVEIKDLKKGPLRLYFHDLENYRDDATVIDLSKTPGTFTVKLEGKTIFDPETGYVIIRSKTELSQADIDEIIKCIGSRKEHDACYDHSKIMISIAI